ncbi:MAG: hypothetical protein JNG85_09075 [Spirochaetaceae bacterium]|nr:hypothetical protein [Spirochaetaceae bacterium]
MDPTGTFAIFAIFIAVPTIVFGFIYLSKRSKHEVEKLKYRKEILELEVDKETIRLESLREENRKLDRMISDGRDAR